MSNPSKGPRCPACRMGLVTHVKEDPQCLAYEEDKDDTKRRSSILRH